MKTFKNFRENVARLKKIADDITVDAWDRVAALTELYFWYQCDVRNQALCVRQIAELARCYAGPQQPLVGRS